MTIPGQASRLEGAKRFVYARPRTDVAEAHRAAGELALHLFFPDGWRAGDRRGAALFFHGGGWRNGFCDQFAPFARDLADFGLVAGTAEYRLARPPGVMPRRCVGDARSAVRWMRDNAATLGVDPLRLAVGGGSAGGHLALTCADDRRDDSSSRPDALLLMNPVLRMDGSPFEDLFGGPARAAALSPVNRVPRRPPPAVVFLGTRDNLIPVAQAEALRDAWTARDGRCDLHLYEGAEHGFFNPDRDTQAFDDVRRRTRDFLASLGFVAQGTT